MGRLIRVKKETEEMEELAFRYYIFFGFYMLFARAVIASARLINFRDEKVKNAYGGFKSNFLTSFLA